MNVILKNFTFIFMHNRNVVHASACDEAGNILKNDQLSNLLHQFKKEGHVVVNAQDVLNELVLVRGFTA